ncbi:dehalogenase [Dehalococcoides mccartyi CG1]|uniref:dehalogenase n=1 Tax=Dehalococcoides mccartyi TaxID=61435 RepID=UPI0004E0A9CD|nr:dehalogenase [Dehalococcoides mccartyi]AII58467.1 dehalogenase [Dehalococcoides mccartyi CG1]
MWSSTVLYWGLGMALSGAFMVWFGNYMKSRNLLTKWHDWVLGLTGMLLLAFTIQNVYGSFAENETLAAYLMLLFFGLPAIILLGLTWQLINRRNKKS